MTRPLIVHLGAPKTGTTSFQTFLQRNAVALSGRLEVQTPVAGSPTRAMGRAALAYSLDPATEARFVEAIKAVQADLVHGVGLCLISHENLLGAVPGNGGTVGLYPQILPILRLLDRHLAPMQPVYALYTRAMPAWKASVHSQIILSDGYAGTLSDYLAETADIGSWDALEATLRAALGPDRLSVFRLEEEPDPAFPGQQLLQRAGLTMAEITALRPMHGRQNARTNPATVEFVRRVNTLGLPPGPRAKVATLAAQNQILFTSQDISGQTAQMSD